MQYVDLPLVILTIFIFQRQIIRDRQASRKTSKGSLHRIRRGDSPKAEGRESHPEAVPTEADAQEGMVEISSEPLESEGAVNWLGVKYVFQFYIRLGPVA